MIKRRSYMEDLVNYIKRNLKKGYTKESLKWALISQGYSKIEVEKAIERVDSELSISAPIIKVKPEIRYQAFDASGIQIEPEESSFQKIKNFFRNFWG